MRVIKKVIVVTGAGSGIGRELTLQLLQKGAKVAALDISLEGLSKTVACAADLSTDLAVYEVNMADNSAVENVVTLIKERFGTIDGIVNNAGIIQPFIRVQNLTRSQIERVMDVNFYGPLNLIQATLPELLTRPEAHVLNVSSMGGFFPVPGQVIYGASKAAVKLLTEGLYAELIDSHVGVTVVFPGAIMTDITRNSGVEQSTPKQSGSTPKGTLPENAAKQMIHAIEHNKPRVFIGKDSVFMDRFYRLAPQRATRFMQKQMQKFITIG